MQYFGRSAVDGNYMKNPIFPEDEGSQKGEPRGPEVGPPHRPAAQGLAAPPCEEGAHSPLSPPFLRVHLRPENLSPEDSRESHSRLCGVENTREKRALRRAGIRRGNSLPEGEIDAIVTVIELDIISITIVIISIIITAISTAASRHRSAGGTFMSITLGEATKLLDNMMINYSEWHTERAPQGKKVNSVEETSSLSDKIDAIMSMLVNDRTNIDPNNVPLASLVAQEEHVDVNFIKNNNFNNNAYRNNSSNNYRPYPYNNGNGYGNSYGNSYNNNRSSPPGLEAMLKEFISTQTAFNKSVEEKLGKIDILASKVDSLAADVDLLKSKVLPNENHHNKITTTANAIQVRINENIRLMAELRARWDREENEKLAKEKNIAKVWTITTTSNANATHVAAPPTNTNKRIGVSNVSTSNAKREKLPETAKTAETACDKAAEIFSNIGDDDPIALDYNGLNFDDCHISEVIKFLQKLAKSPNASAINLAFTHHITNALIKAREEKLEREASIPKKLEDGWEPIIKMKVKDFDCNALCDLGASISVMPKKIYNMLDLPPLKNCYLDVNLADHSTKKPLGKVDNVRITVNNNLVPVDFVVLDIECNASCPIILGRPFLRTVGAIIDMKEGIAMDEVRKKLFSISLSGKAAHWYKLLKNRDSIDWEDIVPLFYSKFYPPSEIHKDRNRIYNFWPHDGESIAQAWGRLKSLMLKCPIHELPGNVIIDNFYARLSFQDKTLLDTSCSGSFTRNKEEFKRDLLDRIQENTEGWENDKDRESGINFDYKCIEVFMDTDKFRNISATYGLDSQVVANLYKAFASHYELPKKNFDKYHEPYKDKIDSSINKCVVIETVDHVIPEAYIEKTPFPAKMKEYSVINSAVHKSEKKPIEPEEQIKVEPAVAIIKDLVTENVEDGHIIFCEDASNIVSHPNKSRKASVPMLSVRIGDHCYYGLCDIGASISAIPYELYTEIMHEIGSCELEDIDVVIRLANRETISPIGIVRDVEVLCGKIKYPADFLVLGSAASKYCPIIFGRPFLNTCGAIIDCKKEKILTKFAGESYEFNFSKFAKTPYKADLPNNDFRVEQCASIALAPNNPLQQHLENSESEVFREERNELDEIFLRQPILKHDLPVEDLGTTPPPKEDPVFDLKPLPDNLKYAHIDDKKIYPVIISSKLSDIEEERLLEILKKHRGAIGYTLDDLKGISPSICQHAINMEDDAKPVVEHQRRLIPKMKEVVRNEVLKLLEAGIIYPIADSRWVSPVHCVPKKGGMTVVPNDNDELIPQRVVVGYRMCIDFRKVNKVFMDDFSVYGNSFDNCLRNLDKVLQRCEETNLVLNWEKCHFMVNEGIVLGHKISERGIEVDRAKVEAIEKMPYPRDVKGIRSVLGHAGFYRRFIKDFSKISKPLTNLLQKDVPFVFDDDCKEAFETLKKALTTAPVVEPPDWNLPFEIMCDASDFAVGAVLGQRVDKKLNVIHYAITIHTDHAAIRYLMTKKDAKPRLIRWVLLLQEFDLHIVDRKGADNPVADNLSRLENIAYDPVPVNDSFPNEQLAVIKVSSRDSPWIYFQSRSAMVSNNKDKEPMEENIQDPEWKEVDESVKEEDEEEVEEDSRAYQRATIASIKVVENPFNAKKSARIRTGGRVPRHYLAPKTSSPGTHHPFRNLIYNNQIERTPKAALPSNWDIDRSNTAGRMKPEAEEWGNNSKSWDSPSDILLNRVEHNSEMIRNLMYKIDELQELVEKLVKNSPSSPKE
ncbi:hypothetical protein QYE76_014176 [Lolium multiflorum]|uniref:RNA-directed DNA polymerase n=1 Tax=Lolium multiflorum TaxID=4521 RepID=A0AAD8U495_LOLMU|nr:hypothetical protein QYE76_014176 [Lolium multiflorum]